MVAGDTLDAAAIAGIGRTEVDIGTLGDRAAERTAAAHIVVVGTVVEGIVEGVGTAVEVDKAGTPVVEGAGQKCPASEGRKQTCVGV